ncbi:MAG TPA: aminotransferase class V-fold PLP-dependent enzyme [Gemmatimonadales bacterium]|nr:aminotransferase class V-fold PLP-dependent enzyme [Gemmatimonadales bacterium]
MTARMAGPALAPLERWRSDTPGCRDRIHLNNAGAALMPRPVLDALIRHLEREAAIGGYEAADEAAPRVQETYELVARLVGATARHIALVENATVAFAQALSAFDFHAGDRIVTTRTDYPSNQLMYLSLARRAGVVTVRADDLPEGGVDPESVRRLARDPRTRLVALSWVPTNSGLVQEARAVGAVCAELGVPYLVDACQSVGQMAVDVGELRCDFLCATARKFLRGPRGMGFLYVSDRMLERGAFPLLVDLRGADWTDPDAFRLADGARRFENWEFAYALVLALGAAARYALEVGPGGSERAWRLAALLRERLAALPGVRVLDRGRARCAIVSIAVAGRDADELKLRLRERGINTSAAAREHGVLDMDDKAVTSVLRLSPHYYNTEDELDGAVRALRELTGA